MPDVRLIDANALQRAFDDAHKDEPDFFCCNFLNNAGNPSTEWECVDEILENAPTVDAQPVKRGKWLETHCDLICGVCKWEYSDELPYMSQRGYDSYYEAFAYCPHCGSRLSPPDGAVYEIEDFGGDKNGNQV